MNPKLHCLLLLILITTEEDILSCLYLDYFKLLEQNEQSSPNKGACRSRHYLSALIEVYLLCFLCWLLCRFSSDVLYIHDQR